MGPKIPKNGVVRAPLAGRRRNCAYTRNRAFPEGAQDSETWPGKGKVVAAGPQRGPDTKEAPTRPIFQRAPSHDHPPRGLIFHKCVAGAKAWISFGVFRTTCLLLLNQICVDALIVRLFVQPPSRYGKLPESCVKAARHAPQRATTGEPGDLRT